jgi:hypothetical protein
LQPCQSFYEASRQFARGRHIFFAGAADPRFSCTNQFYDWLKKFFENGHLAFANGRKSKADEDVNVEKIQKIEAKLTRKNEVMAELMEAHTVLKKELGEL